MEIGCAWKLCNPQYIKIEYAATSTNTLMIPVSEKRSNERTSVRKASLNPVLFFINNTTLQITLIIILYHLQKVKKNFFKTKTFCKRGTYYF